MLVLCREVAKALDLALADVDLILDSWLNLHLC